MDESDISQLEATLAATKQTGKVYLQAAFTKFILNWVFLTLFYLILLDRFPILIGALGILLPLLGYSLYNIYQQNRQFRQKIEEMEVLITEIKESQH